jgi:hypothetical protein
MRSYRLLSVILLVVLAVNGGLIRSFAQAPLPQVREVAAYSALIAAMARVEEKTRTQARAGLRNAVVAKIGLSPSDFSSFLDLCKTAEERIRPLDSRAGEIIAATRAKYKGGKAGPVPPPPAELLALQAEKDNIVRETISTFDTRLTVGGRAKVAAYLASLLAVQGQASRGK